jgi:transcriptional regulator with XRE-family HTH domain
MNSINKRKKWLMQQLKSKEFRDEYVSSGVDVGVSFQIRALREQQKPKSWTQKDLAIKSNMQQERISALENPSHSPTLATLKKIANAFDVGLVVRFVPFSDLLKWDINLSSQSLYVPTFEEDEYFREQSDRQSFVDDMVKDLLPHHAGLTKISDSPLKKEVSSFTWGEKKQLGYTSAMGG